jgi:hypothetical protein
MSIEEVSAEKLAELFHHYHHTLAYHHNGTTESMLKDGNKCRSRREVA